jgi:hypothetical protein
MKKRIKVKQRDKRTDKHDKKKGRVTLPVVDEWWTVVQVASFLELSYHTARNQMLSGAFGKSQYDAESRTLRVSASKVKAKAPAPDKQREII